MARDDYHVIVYQILAYLYTCLKSGNEIDADMLRHNSRLCNINEKYWTYIMTSMIEQGFVRGPTITKPWGTEEVVSDLGSSVITPQGIEYLCDNSFMSKVKGFLKDLKEITPFV